MKIGVSLDITILGPDGRPSEQVSIGLENHDQLMRSISRSDCMLKRLNDYYADAEFHNTELDSLIKELLIVREHGQNNEPFLLFLNSFIALAEQGKRKQLPLIAIAD